MKRPRGISDLRPQQHRGRGGRPKGRRGSVPYRSRLITDLLQLVTPAEASDGAKALAEEARHVLRRALRRAGSDPKSRACCDPRVFAAILVLQEVGVREPDARDFLAEVAPKG